MKFGEVRTRIVDLIHGLTTQQWTWIVAAMLCGFIAFYFDVTSSKGSSSTPTVQAEGLDSPATFIPAGFVLVPIEVANFESLDSILGKFGIVDLYLPSDDPKKRARKVGEKLKILRAPLNPSRFAVLVREDDSAKLVSHNGAFTVVVQNPERAGTGFVNPDVTPGHRRPSRITVEVLNASQN
jgi:hypothetical protein